MTQKARGPSACRRVDRTPAGCQHYCATATPLYPLAVAARGDGTIHRQHLHASGATGRMSDHAAVPQRHCREPSGDSGDAQANHPCGW